MDNLIFKFFNMQVLSDVWPYLLKGLWITVRLTLITMATSLMFGLIVALFRVSKNKFPRVISKVYVDVFRGTPLLVQIIIIFYALPDLGIMFDRFSAGIVALTLNNGAYVAEIFRAGIESLPKGQMEAARSLGLTHIQAMIKVIIPQAFKSVLPALTNSIVALLKDTSLVSVIGVEELLKQGRQLQSWQANSTPLMFAAILYLVAILPLLFLVNKMERGLKKAS